MLKLSQYMFEGQWWTPCLNMPSNHPHEVAIVDIWLSIGIDSKLFNLITDFQLWCQRFLALSNKHLHIFQKLHICHVEVICCKRTTSHRHRWGVPVRSGMLKLIDWWLGVALGYIIEFSLKAHLKHSKFLSKEDGVLTTFCENCFEDKGSTF